MAQRIFSIPKPPAWLKRTASWLSIVGAVFGFLSLLSDLIPNLVRLSLLFKAATALYRLAREAVYDGIQWPFELVGFHVPEISGPTKDALVIASLVMAALNFESVVRHKQTLTAAFANIYALQFRWLFALPLGKPKDEEKEAIDDSDSSILVAQSDDSVSAIVLLGGFVVGFLSWGPLLTGLALAGHAHWFSTSLKWLGVALGIFLLTEILRPLSGHHPLVNSPPEGPVSWTLRGLVYAFYIPPMFFAGLANAVLNGRRSALVVFVLVIGLWLLSLFFAYVIDPTITSPPSWLLDLIRADPQSIATSR